MQHKIVTVEEMVAIEKEADANGHSYAAMMQHAGTAAADFVLAIAEWRDLELNICVLVGPGNNGGDGLVMATRLIETHADASVSAYLFKPRQDEVAQAAVEAGVYLIQSADDEAFTELRNEITHCDILVDALFGTGLRLPLRDNVKVLLQTVAATIRAQRQKAHTFDLLTMPERTHERPLIVALDCPSGLDCNTGDIDDDALKANYTITFAAAKYGHFNFPGAAYVGELAIGDIGLPESSSIHDITTEIATAIGRLPARLPNSHKGTYGKAMIVAGSPNYIGAAYLCAMGAYRSGAGLVTVATSPEIIHPLAAQTPEATWLYISPEITQVSALKEGLQQNYNALLMGPGWGQHEQKKAFLLGVLESHSETALPPLVLDADALNMLATVENWHEYLPPNTIITPHPGEFGRLSGLSTNDVQSNRVQVAKDNAAKWNCIVVLKGAHTVIAAPDGHAWISPISTDALAVAGTGDVLAGMIVGLLAQGRSTEDAAVAAVWLHGQAGRLAGTLQTRSTTATEVLNWIDNVFIQLRDGVIA
jgi:ADP-dependent NAD(P)H-hydrate dehydratase / NAD(P)H-hydrate epimerase